jgi:tRNA (guanine-N7-)-methyltransferase
VKNNKLQKFADNLTFSNLFQYPFLHREECPMRGRWHSDYFKNDFPIVIEIGCGKGEYTIGLSEKYPNKNFIGIDIKGARLWKGSRYAFENNLNRVAFVRARIDFIEKIFAPEEVSEIWITFPDPQHAKARKRLTSPMFLERYRKILRSSSNNSNNNSSSSNSSSSSSSSSSSNGNNASISSGANINGSRTSINNNACNAHTGKINLKTDDTILYLYTLDDIVLGSGLPLYAYSDDIYANTDESLNDVRAIRTFYEEMWLKMGKKIKYISFGL